MSKVTCRCEQSFDADLPQEIDLDREPAYLGQILGGSFLALTCPHCGATLKPEVRLQVKAASQGQSLLVLPEGERLSFYLGNVQAGAGEEVLLGFAELFERAALLRDGLDPETVEIIKYYLTLKAEDGAPEGAEVRVRYEAKEGTGADARLHFLVSGLKEGELARLPVGLDHYDKVRGDKKRLLATEPFVTFMKGPYRSLRALEMEA